MDDYVPQDTPTVFIGICGERMDIPDFEASLDRVNAHTQNVSVVEIHRARGHRVDRNRDKIVKAFLASKRNPDYLLFLDSDMTFPERLIDRLVEWELDVVGGLYFHRRWNFPFAFKEVGIKVDEWGREVPFHQYMFDDVYDFLRENNIPKRNQAVAIDAPGRLLQVDAIGTGAMLIHRSVIEELDGPWFEYVGGAESEDLTFCRKARQAGFEIFADLGTICGHLKMVAGGYAEFMGTYEARGVSVTNYSVDTAIRMLSEITGVTLEAARERIMKYRPMDLAELWNDMEFAEGGNLRPLDFYLSRDAGELYIPELIRWNASPSFGYFREQLNGAEGLKVLEIGSGIGSMAIQLAAQRCDVDAYEANGVLRDFARKRLRWTEDNDLFWGARGNITWHGPFKAGVRIPADVGYYDLAIGIDIFEHLTEEELIRVIGYISTLLKVGGRLYAHNAWGDQTTEGVHPFHYDHSELWPDLMKQNGLFQTSDLWYLKVGDRIE